MDIILRPHEVPPDLLEFFEVVNGDALTDTWVLGPEPSRLNHYAGFPTEIPRRCILAGTSEKGACPSCGAPWGRATSHPCEACGVAIPQQGKSCKACGHVREWKAGRKAMPEMLGDDWTAGPRVPRLPGGFSNTNTGKEWSPGCTCDAGDPVPCVVLDPFLGSGTTLLVADRLGRSGIGCDLNPEYVEMARKRIDQDAGPMLADPVTVESPRQRTLWEATAS